MDSKAIEIVRNYIVDHLDRSDKMPEFEVYVVWKCKALQNWKYLLSSTLFDGMYYEMTCEQPLAKAKGFFRSITAPIFYFVGYSVDF